MLFILIFILFLRGFSGKYYKDGGEYERYIRKWFKVSHILRRQALKMTRETPKPYQW